MFFSSKTDLGICCGYFLLKPTGHTGDGKWTTTQLVFQSGNLADVQFNQCVQICQNHMIGR